MNSDEIGGHRPPPARPDEAGPSQVGDDANFEVISLRSIPEQQQQQQQQQSQQDKPQETRPEETNKSPDQPRAVFTWDFDDFDYSPPQTPRCEYSHHRGQHDDKHHKQPQHSIPHLRVTFGDESPLFPLSRSSSQVWGIDNMSSRSYDFDAHYNHAHHLVPQMSPNMDTMVRGQSQQNKSIETGNNRLEPQVNPTVVATPHANTPPTTPRTESFVPIIISAKDLEAAFFPENDDDLETSGVGGGKENAKSKLFQRTKSFHEKIQRVLLNGKDKNNNDGHEAIRPKTSRMSIMGTKLPTKHTMWGYRQRVFIYNLLQRPKGWAYLYHAIVVLLILISLILVVLVTIPEYSYSSQIVLKVVDLIICTILVVEFVLRMWSSRYISKYQGVWGFVRFLWSPFRIIDAIVLISSALVIWSDWSGAEREDSLYWLRLLHVLQAMRFESRFQSWRIMSHVLYAQKDHLLIVVFMAFLSFLVISFVVYFTERNQADTQFTSLAASMWWAIITVFTIGYGDMAPTSTAGKICAAILILFACILFALPSGVLGTGLALKVDEKMKVRHVHKRRIPAARLIQATWRCYAGSEESTSLVTWKIRPPNVISPSPSVNLFKSKMISSPLNRTHGRSHHQHSQQQQQQQSQRQTARVSVICNEKQKNCIRFIRKLKFLVAKKNFKAASRPFDINDVLEQYSAGHTDVIGKVKGMNLQINSLQYQMARTLKAVKLIQYYQSIHMSRLESVISSIAEKMPVTSSSENNKPTTTIRTPSFSLANLSQMNVTESTQHLPQTFHSEQYLQVFVNKRSLSSISSQQTNNATPVGERKNKVEDGAKQVKEGIKRRDSC